MKSNLKYILGFFLTVLFALGIYNVASIYNLKMLKNDIDYSVINKNMKNAVSLTMDNNKNIYVAKSTFIKMIMPDGKEKILLSGSEYDIEDILYDDNKIYFISKNNVKWIGLDTLCVDCFKDDIPLSGNDVNRRIFKIKNDICIAIGAKTNSGVSEDKNYEVPSFDVVLNGNNFGKNDNVAYCKVPENKCLAGEKISHQNIGNAAIYRIDKKTKEFKLFANGIRAVTGIDTDSEGNVYAAFQGMGNYGIRPVKDDADYIYEVKPDRFYGFPDFSGGDYIESPRFEDDSNNLVKPILLNIPKSFDRQAAPIYVSSKQGSLKSLAIDKDGGVFENGSILFFDNNSKEVQVLNKEGKISKVIKTSDKSEISDILYCDKNVYMIDSSLGYMYKISRKTADKEFNIPLSIWIYITGFSVILIILIILKCIRRKK